MPEQSGNRIALLLVDDHTLFRESVARLLEAEPDFQIVAHCASVAAALKIVAVSQVDIVLLDFDLGGGKGTEFLQQAEEAGFRGKVLIVTAGVSELEAGELMRKGIAGIFMKHSAPVLLIESIRQVAMGRSWFEPDYLKTISSGVNPPDAQKQRKKLTERERQVLQYVFEGLANKEIADRLGLSESSVKASLQQLFTKTGVRTRSQLVRVAIEQYRDEL